MSPSSFAIVTLSVAISSPDFENLSEILLVWADGAARLKRHRSLTIVTALTMTAVCDPGDQAV